MAWITVVTMADITGDGSAHQISFTGSPRWVQVTTLSTNSAAVRLGDANVSASRGMPVDPGAGQMLPQLGHQDFYNATALYYFAAPGDKVSITYAN